MSIVGPKNSIVRIDKIWAWVSVDAKDGYEGVCAGFVRGMWTPLIAADKARLKSMRILAEGIARESGMKLKLVEFSTRREIEEIGP
jgi:hypothetical protein